MFKPERIMSAGEVEAYARYVEWRAERAGPLAERHYTAHLEWVERCRCAEAGRRAAAQARAAAEVARQAELEFRAAEAARRDEACRLEKVRRAEKVAARMKSLGFRHPCARPTLKLSSR